VDGWPPWLMMSGMPRLALVQLPNCSWARLVGVVQPGLGFGNQVAAAQAGIRAHTITEQLLHICSRQVDRDSPVGQFNSVVLKR
jgi:hypothetical protein